jgi:chemotaxis protein MotB
MSKKKGGPVWLATFADLMSLLMALFVLLFSMANVDVTKYKAVVDSFNETLGNGDELTPEQVGFFKTTDLSMIQPSDMNLIQMPDVSDIKEEALDKALKEQMLELKNRLTQRFQIGSNDNPIGISYNSKLNQIKMIFPEQIAFESGSAELKPKFQKILEQFYEFQNEPVSIQVVGHTDHLPIRSFR